MYGSLKFSESNKGKECSSTNSLKSVLKVIPSRENPAEIDSFL